jgi:hypothetical protein
MLGQRNGKQGIRRRPDLHDTIDRPDGDAGSLAPVPPISPLPFDLCCSGPRDQRVARTASPPAWRIPSGPRRPRRCGSKKKSVGRSRRPEGRGGAAGTTTAVSQSVNPGAEEKDVRPTAAIFSLSDFGIWRPRFELPATSLCRKSLESLRINDAAVAWQRLAGPDSRESLFTRSTLELKDFRLFIFYCSWKLVRKPLPRPSRRQLVRL